MLWTNQPLVGGASPKGTNLYLRRADGSFVVLTRAGAPTSADGGALSGASQDFTRLFIVSTVKQRSADPVTGGNTYEWANGDLKLVTVLPGPGEEPAPNGGTLPQGALPAVSDDGTEVLFKAGGFPGLYLRSNGENTVQVSVSKRSTPDPNPVAPAIAVGIAADGSEVLFTSRSELTDDANTGRTLGVPNDQGNDIYSYDVGTGVLTDLTVADNPADVAAGADVEKVVGASRDASYVYFIARGNLAEGATSGERNLYVEHEGTVDFIGTDPTGSTLQGYPFYVTPDGRHAAFMSTEGQTGYDSEGQSEVYRVHLRQRGRMRIVPAERGAAARQRLDRRAGAQRRRQPALLPERRCRHPTGAERAFQRLRVRGRRCPSADARRRGHLASRRRQRLRRRRLHRHLRKTLSAESGGRLRHLRRPRQRRCPARGTAGGLPGRRLSRDGDPATAALEPGHREIRSAGNRCGAQIEDRDSLEGPGADNGARAGELSVLGRGLTPVKQPASGVETVTLALTSKADKRRLKKGFFKTTAEILFTSGSGALSRAEISLKFKATAKAKSGK